MADSPKRVGFVGLSTKGFWSTHAHLPYLQKTSRYKIMAIQNSSKESAEAAIKTYSLDGAGAYGDAASIAKDANVDIVAIGVTVPLHYEPARQAVEAGKDVFSEWPLARNLAEAEELTRLAKEKGVKTMVGLQARQNPAIIKAREIVASGKLGRILGTTLFGHSSAFGPVMPDNLSYSLPIEAGANTLTIPFGHTVDALCYVLDSELKDISATLSNHYPEVQLTDADSKPLRKAKKTAHDYVSISATLANGGGNVDVTYAPALSRSGRDLYWEIIGTEGTLVLQGPKMGGHMQMFQPTIRLAVGQEELKEVEVEKAAAGDFSFNVGKAWDAWADVGLDKGQSVTTWEDAVVRHKMIEAIYRSAEKGTRENYV